MTDTSSSAVGRVAIDAYLDSVEQALIAAHAPRSDRMQVLQDLESQISDMLAQQVLPLTEEMVASVIARLEPPSHFARTYGNGKESPPSARERLTQLRRVRLPYLRWSIVSAVSCALLPGGVVLAFLAANAHGLSRFALLLAFIGLVLTPFALGMARKLRAQSDPTEGRHFVLQSTVVYGVIAPTLLMAFVTAATEGYALVPFGIVAFVYFQYLLIRRVYRYMADAAPRPAAVPDENGASSPAGAVTPYG
ncbi:MAG: hypothetical protein ABIU95_00030 [Burkholderiales bacterium]